MFKLKEYTRRGHASFAFNIRNPHEEERQNRHCLLNICLFNRSWWFKIPEIIKPRYKWVDLSNQEWAHTNKDGTKGYWDYIPKEYGFSCTEDAVHIHYGIQPGCWSRDNPKDSDHTKLFWYPWNLEIYRHDLLLPNGDVYHRNLYPRKKDEKHISWHHVFDWPRTEDKHNVQVQVAVFVTLEHTTKSGKVQKARIRLTGEEREWRRFRLPFGKYVKRVVDCESDIELGEKAGSWKGGMIGWSCDWRHNETLEQAFWRWYKEWDGR